MEKQLEELIILRVTVRENDCYGILNWVKAKLTAYKITIQNGPIFNAVMDIRNELTKKQII